MPYQYEILPNDRIIFEPHHEKTSNAVSEQVQHKPSCTSKGDGKRLETLVSESRGIVLSV